LSSRVRITLTSGPVARTLAMLQASTEECFFVTSKVQAH